MKTKERWYFDDIPGVIAQLTLEEKARLIGGATFFGSYPVERLGIPRLQLLDGATGLNYEQIFGDITQYCDWSHSQARKDAEGENLQDVNMIGSTALAHVIAYYFEPEKLKEEELPLYHWIKGIMDERLKGEDYAPGCYPPGTLLGCTWNKDVVRAVGEALSLECCLLGIHILLGPNINLLRDPRNGRFFEAYSEDPYLIKQLGPSIVQGIQSHGVVATVKHYAANSQETNRLGVDETISRRALEEMYLPGFKACVQEGKTRAIMNSYNNINGVASTENKWLLQDKLRDEFGFDGIVMSDWGAVTNQKAAFHGGTNYTMPGPYDYQGIIDLVNSGDIDEATLDSYVAMYLELINWIGQHRPEDITKTHSVSDILAQTDQAAYEAAKEGIVMLKNTGLCPLDADKKVAIVGTGSRRMMECGTGSAGIDTSRYGDFAKELGAFHTVVDDVRHADVAVVVCSMNGMEGNDRNDLFLQSEDRALLKELKDMGKDVILVLNTSGPMDLQQEDTDNVKAIFATFLCGMKGAKALAELISGKSNPSGKLAFTFPKRLEDVPSYFNFPGDGYHVNYGEGIFVGYRYYDTKKIAPKYAFGYGLSYTQFAVDYDELPQQEQNGSSVELKVRVKNIGDMAGSEVVQIYAHDPYAVLTKPKKELVAFEKVYLEPGEEKILTITVQMEELKSFDPNLGEDGAWALEGGYYDLILATSSFDEDQKAVARIHCIGDEAYWYGTESTVKIICEQPQLYQFVREAWAAQGWDLGVIENNYQYSPHRKLKEMIPDLLPHERTPEKVEAFLEMFAKGAATVIKE